MLAQTIGMIGAGRMATALAHGLIQAELIKPASFLVSDPNEAARAAFERDLPGTRVLEDNREVARQSDVLWLAVKPQQMTAALAELRDSLRSDALVVSIAAGVTLASLAAGLPAGQRIVRVMPNTPALVGQAASAYSLNEHATPDDSLLVAKMLFAIGVGYEVPEEQLDAVTGLSGSGPAFVYTMMEQLCEGGVRVGLPAKLAADLAVRTVAGAAEMVLASGETPAELRDRVISPGGTTLAGLDALKKAGFDAAVIAAVEAATRRSKELGKSPT